MGIWQCKSGHNLKILMVPGCSIFDTVSKNLRMWDNAVSLVVHPMLVLDVAFRCSYACEVKVNIHLDSAGDQLLVDEMGRRSVRDIG